MKIMIALDCVSVSAGRIVADNSPSELMRLQPELMKKVTGLQEEHLRQLMSEGEESTTAVKGGSGFDCFAHCTSVSSVASLAPPPPPPPAIISSDTASDIEKAKIASKVTAVESPSKVVILPSSDGKPAPTKLVQSEIRKAGVVSVQTYLAYFAAGFTTGLESYPFYEADMSAATATPRTASKPSSDSSQSRHTSAFEILGTTQ